ncbi:hypothetical protein IFM89_039440 [Coptis chinensis]|uniref:Calcium uniporter protein C-terminal domain-containing protein n=1 Tax=Coptis chinensis TaxID=261450 RepID=A0A835I915_9MAGN|nr:hypothetical protein IFM89_039440 [Coptis chinensis]
MACRKTLAHRLYNVTKISSMVPNPAITTFRRHFLNPSEPNEKGFFKRFLQKRDIVQSATSTDYSPTTSMSLIGNKLMKKLKEINTDKDRIRLDGLSPPLKLKPREPPEVQISVEDAKKILRITQLEILKSKLRMVPRNCISYSEFLEICRDGSSFDEGMRFAKMLDDSGSVIVLGNFVFLRPEQVTKAIQGIIPLSLPQPNDPRRQELEMMEKEKLEIDKQADSLVRKELWAGLGFLVVQTAGFVRLTFWELSWDVMEPICFYLTSIYFMAGYAFFLRTSKDPSFEGLFESRFSAKQKRLMRIKKFDIQRFEELRRACYPLSLEPPSSNYPAFDTSDRNLIGAH